MAGPPALSPTVADLARELGDERATTAQIVTGLLRRHPEYGDRVAASLRVDWPARMRRVPIERCLDEVTGLFRPDTHTPLHGRAVIVGVALLDRDAGRAMIEAGLFWRIAAELRPSLVESVSDEGTTRLEPMPLAAAMGGRPPTPVADTSGGGLRGLFFTRDGSGLLSAHSDPDRVMLWRDGSGQVIDEDNPSTGGLVRLLKARLERRPEMWSYDGDRHAAVEGGTVVVLDAGGKELARLGADVSGFRLADDGRFVATGEPDGVAVWDVASGSAIQRVGFADVRLIDLRGDQVALGGVEKVWANGAELDIGRSVGDLSWRSDGAMLAIADEDGWVTLWNPSSGAIVGKIRHDPGLRAVAFSPDGRTLAAGNDRAIWTSNVDLPPRRRFATYDPDTARGDKDLLDIDTDVEAFATLIAARSLVPPLSIGLFGHWGAGKSFFMRRLRGRVREIAQEARESGRVQQDVDFYKYIAQVEFNAWHYVEGNLWASLVQNIFENLHVEKDVDDRTARARRADRLLRSAEKKLQAATEQAESAALHMEAIANRVTALEQTHQARLRELEEERQRDALRRVVGQEVVQLVTAATAPLGVTALTDAGRDLVDSYTRARQEVEGGLPVMRVLTNPRDPATRRLRLTLVGVVGAGLLLAGVALALRDTAGRVAGAISAVAVVVGGVAGWLRRFGDWVAARRVQLDTAGQALQGAIDKLRNEHAQRLAELEGDETRARAELQAALVAKEEAQTELDRQRVEQQLPPAELLGRLIKSRLESGDYRRHLGVLALIREDFSDVADMVAENNRWLEANEDLDAENIEDRVDRIVLYIDDLDRCPPRRVVEVLEAVHLLLAFPLFVVVVGVDPRWVLKALEAHYWELLVPDEREEPSARPIDYVEKIFQVPYQLRPMTTGVTRNMLAGLVPVAQPATTAAPGPAGSDGAPGTADRAAAVTPAAANPAATGAGRRAGGRDLTPGSLQIEVAELEVMRALAPLLGSTPRTIKRFVNVYRLMKVRAQDRPNFLREQGDASEYRLVMLLLAACAGLPDETPALLHALRTADPAAPLGGLPEAGRLLERLEADGKRWADIPAGAYAPFVDDVQRFSFVLDEA